MRSVSWLRGRVESIVQTRRDGRFDGGGRCDAGETARAVDEGCRRRGRGGQAWPRATGRRPSPARPVPSRPAPPASRACSPRCPRPAQQIATLKAAQTKIASKIASGRGYYGDINLQDLRSFGINALWNKGIDGAGTSVAVIEGWDLPSIQSTLNSLDNQIGLPHTTVQTVYPAGPLPAKCPAGMQSLGDYGSCDAWGGELTLDVEAVHLFAPYAKIIVSATPADSEVNEDRSSQVAPPEMMKALEVPEHQPSGRRHLDQRRQQRGRLQQRHGRGPGAGSGRADRRRERRPGRECDRRLRRSPESRVRHRFLQRHDHVPRGRDLGRFAVRHRPRRRDPQLQTTPAPTARTGSRSGTTAARPPKARASP